MRRAVLVLSLLPLLALAARSRAQELTTTLPDAIAHRAEGCWQIAAGYRITFERSGHGLRARHHIGHESPAVTEVQFLPGDTFGTPRVRSIHGGWIVFRVRHRALEVSFYSGYSHDATGWEPATRCAR